ncbi:pre-16S rRNA nuclease, Ribonuclease H-like domain protein [Artemisia annua]|uniref:Pre-16S rRNA nuclease, Ribonuclease H-like domain protein n=1 Tax=Artemisia annua TaxID=35608 RepID=A0A2U1PYM4_ARTAN|nr:pre-16S rRNA nuclease, Ribonuclease H-like domain protein [Artemisia annua]
MKEDEEETLTKKEEVDEFIIGMPVSSDGKETPQSNKVRSFASRIAVQAAERGGKIDEPVGLDNALKYVRVKTSGAGKEFSESGERTEMVLPKQLDLQEKLRKGPPPEDLDFF